MNLLQGLKSSEREVSSSLAYAYQSDNANSSKSLDSDNLLETSNATEPATTDVSEQLLAHLLLKIGQNAFDLWFRRNTHAEIASGDLYLEVDSDFLVDCIRSFCFKELRETVTELYGAATGIVVRRNQSFVPTTPATPPNSVARPHLAAFRDSSLQVAVSESVVVQPLVVSQPAAHNRQVVHNEARKDTFEQASVSGIAHPIERPTSINDRKFGGQPVSARAALPAARKPVAPFLQGTSNRLAMTASEMIIERPGELGPLFIHGTNGVGKSHLTKVIAEQLRARHGLRRVMVMTAEQFTIDFSESTRGAGFAAFRKKYRDVEALLLDDVQFFLGKVQTLAELRNTVDDLLGRRRQVVFCADRSLADLVGLGNDLHARLSGGVTCSIDLLDRNLRRDLLQELCKRHQVNVCESTLNDLADSTSGDGRSIYGVVFRMMAQQRSNGGTLSREEALNCTLDLIRASQPIVRLSDIERVVCDTFGIEPKSLKAKSRCKSVSGPRMLAMFLARKHTAAAFSEIGQFFGNRQHSTVISAHKRVEDWVSSNEKLAHRSGTVSVRDLIRNAESMLQVG